MFKNEMPQELADFDWHSKAELLARGLSVHEVVHITRLMPRGPGASAFKGEGWSKDLRANSPDRRRHRM